MHRTIVSPTLGVYAKAIRPPSGYHHHHHNHYINCNGYNHNNYISNKRAIRDRSGVKSAPANLRYRRRERTLTGKSQSTAFATRQTNPFRTTTSSFIAKSSLAKNNKWCQDDQNDGMGLSVDDVICLAEQTKESASQENRRSVLEEAQKSIRHDVGLTLMNSSRPHSVIGLGLQALTSPMPSAKDRSARMQMDHIPTLLPLPSDRTFIPSPDNENPRHATTPIEDFGNVEAEERSQSVARQCCEIMGQSKCRECLKLERRLLNRERAERQYPRFRIPQQNITTTQIVKRLYPHLTDSEIQDRIARGEIAKGSKFLARVNSGRSYANDDDSSDSDVSIGELKDEMPIAEGRELGLAPVGQVVVTTKQRHQVKSNEKTPVVHSDNPIFALTKLKMKLKGQTSTPLYFTDLKCVQAKILSGEVDRKKHLIKPPDDRGRLKSAISTRSTSSSNKSSLSKKGLKLSESLMPVFVSPRKVQIYQEPSYKAYYEPPLLSKRRQIPNPSFFAGSSEAYSLPERLPDIIEFADSKIKALEKQARSASSMSFASNFSEEDPLSSSRKDLDKSENKDGESVFGESMSSSTPRLRLKSANDVIKENFAGEEEHAEKKNSGSGSIAGDDQSQNANATPIKDENQSKSADDNNIEESQMSGEVDTEMGDVNTSQQQLSTSCSEQNDSRKDPGHNINDSECKNEEKDISITLTVNDNASETPSCSHGDNQSEPLLGVGELDQSEYDVEDQDNDDVDPDNVANYYDIVINNDMSYSETGTGSVLMDHDEEEGGTGEGGEKVDDEISSETERCVDSDIDTEDVNEENVDSDNDKEESLQGILPDADGLDVEIQLG